ncbi:MAG: FeoA family protein [Arcobacteraceae bacterium]
MKLSDLVTNQIAIIKSINCETELKKRFYSFGMIKGALLKIENVSFSKNTIGVNIDDTLIALRFEEALNIEVEIIEDTK